MGIIVKDAVNNVDVFSLDADRAPIDPTSITASLISKAGGAWTDTTNTPALTTQGDAPSNPRKYHMNFTAAECDTGGSLTHLVLYGAGGAEIWRETHTVLDLHDTASLEAITLSQLQAIGLQYWWGAAIGANAPTSGSAFDEMTEDDGGLRRFTTNALENGPSGGTSNLTVGDVEGIRERLSLDGTQTTPAAATGLILAIQTLINELRDDGLSNFDGSTDSLRAIRDRGDAGWSIINPLINQPFDFPIHMVSSTGQPVTGTPTVAVQIDNAATPFATFQGTVNPKADGLSVGSALAADMNGNKITFICKLNGAITRAYTYFTRAA